MTPEEMRRAAREAASLSAHLNQVHARLAEERITERRGRATVTLNGLGAIQGITITGLDHETQDCLLAALRAAEGRAQQGYEAFAGRI